MRRFSLALVLIAAAFWLLPRGGRALAQDQNQPSGSGSNTTSSQSQEPENQQPAPQPRKKPTATAKDARNPSSDTSSSSSSDSSRQPASAKDENPFPEAVSRAAAQSPDAPAPSPAKRSSASADNPFPEDISRSAAKRAADSSGNSEDGQKHEDQANAPLPPGVSSSRSADETDQDGGAGSKIDQPVVDPARAKKDIEVGGFYLQTGDYRGAYLRYKDALSHDPTNVDAVFGLAQAARALKLVAEAQQDYKLYLEIVPDGAKAKEAVKALRSLDTQK